MSKKPISKTRNAQDLNPVPQGMGLPLETKAKVPGPASDEGKKDREQGRALAQADQQSHPKHRLDPLSDALGCKGYEHHKHWPWLLFEVGSMHYAMFVTRYYPQINQAIDIGPMNPDYVKRKAELCAENKVKYVHCATEKDLESFVKGSH